MNDDRMARTLLEDGARERLLDAALLEVLWTRTDRGAAAAAAARTPPVQRPGPPRGARAATARPSRSAMTHGSRWFAAAVVLLGLGVTIAVATLRRLDPPAATPRLAQDPVREPAAETGPPPVIAVRELAGVDRATKDLVLHVDDPEQLAPLAGFTRLRRLSLLPTEDAVAPELDWSLRPLTDCRELHSLTIGLLRVVTPDDLRTLRELPGLRELALIGVCHLVDRAFVTELTSLPLRTLRLHAVRIDPAAFPALCELPLLEEIELRDCLHLDRCDLAQLGRARQLHRLVLRGVGGRFADALAKEMPLPGEPKPEIELQTPGVAFRGLGRPGQHKLVLSANAMRALAALPQLRELSLAGSVVDAAVLAALPPRLHALDLRGTIGLTTTGLTAVERLAQLSSFAWSVHPDDSRSPLELYLSSRGTGWSHGALRRILRACPLREVTLEGTPTGALAAALAQGTRVRVLRLCAGALQPSTAAAHPAAGVATLDLSFAAAMPALERLVLRDHAAVAPQPLSASTTLREVQLEGSSAALAEEFRRVLGAGVQVTAVPPQAADK